MSTNSFDDTKAVADAGNPAISKLVIDSGDVLNSIQVSNGSITLPQHGGKGGCLDRVVVSYDDPIVEISGYTGIWYGHHCVLEISIKRKSGKIFETSNMLKSGEASKAFGNANNAGVSSKTPFTITAPEGQSIVAFKGSTINVPLAGGSRGDIIASLDVSFADINAIDRFYAYSNKIIIRIKMKGSDSQKVEAWNEVKNAEPNGGRCNLQYIGKQYNWKEVESVTIEGEDYKTPVTFTDAKIRKKSFCGSFSNSMPSLRIKLGKKQSPNQKNTLGVKTLVLNNSINSGHSDPLFIRQCLAYRIIAMAGLPAPRCNLAELYVNEMFIGAYTNLEAFKKPFIKNNFNHVKGNLYEANPFSSFQKSFPNLKEMYPTSKAFPSADKKPVDYFDFKGFSKDSSKSDVQQVIDANEKNEITKMIDMDEFISFWAMENMLNHIDGYTRNNNNTYIYNDKNLSKGSTNKVPSFKFIHSGLDQLLGGVSPGGSKNRSIFKRYGVAKILAEDTAETPTYLSQLGQRIDDLKRSVFSEKCLKDEVFPYLDQITKQVNDIYKINGKSEIDNEELKVYLRAVKEFNWK